MNKFHHAILLFSLVILLVILVSVIFTKCSTVENSLIPKNTRAISSNGECSVANCGQSGKSYRRAICIDPNGNQIDESNCDPLTRDVLEKDCTNPACAPWNYSTWTPPCDVCLNSGDVQKLQTKTAICSSSDQLYGCDPSEKQEFSQTCSSPACGVNSFHASFSDAVNMSNSLLFGSNSPRMSGNISGNVSVSGNTVTLTPTQNNIYGAYFCIFSWYNITSTSGTVSAPPIKSLTNITLLNMFGAASPSLYSGYSNTGSRSYLIFTVAILIDDPTKTSSITFDTTGTLPPSASFADIFMTQINSGILACLSGTNVPPCVDKYGPARLPYTAIYRGTGGTSQTTSAAYFSNPIQVLDTFDSRTATPTSSSRVTFSGTTKMINAQVTALQVINIPPILSASITANTPAIFLMSIQFTSKTAVGSFSISQMSYVNMTGLSYFSNKSSQYLSNSGSNTTKQLVFNLIFKVNNPTIASTFTFLLGVTGSNISGFDLLITQIDNTMTG